jgi:MOSC domain-containing protein YiiM
MIDAVRRSGLVTSVNVGRTQTFADGKRTFTSAIGKRPRVDRLVAEGEFLEDDEQADLENHGGPDRALYAYAAEDYAWWEGELGRPLAPGLFGENLTVTGIDVSGAVIGERWRIGTAVVRVTSPRVPCFKLAHVVGESDFVKRFAAALRPGAYLAIVEAGDIGAGDVVEILARPERSISLADFTHLYFFDQTRVAELLDVADLTDAWRAWAMQRASPRA